MARIHCLIAAALFWCGAGLTNPARQPLPALGRDLVRPLLLPFLWRSLDSARRDGSPEEYVDKGRLLMQLLPDWTDGHIHLAGRLAFEASMAQTDPEVALDRLLAALRLLEAACVANPNPKADEEYRRTQAIYTFIRCDQDPALARAYRRRNGGAAPLVLIDSYLRKIPHLEHSPRLQSELCFLVIASLPTEIRLGESTERLLAHVATALGQLQHVHDRELAARWRQALQKLHRFLIDADETTVSDLQDEDLLQPIVDALRAR